MSFDLAGDIDQQLEEFLVGPPSHKRPRDCEEDDTAMSVSPDDFAAPMAEVAAPAPASAAPRSLLRSVQAPSVAAPAPTKALQTSFGSASPASPASQAPLSPSLGFANGNLSPRPMFQHTQEISELQAQLTTVLGLQSQMSEAYRKFLETRSEEHTSAAHSLLTTMRESVAAAQKGVAAMWQGQLLNPPDIEAVHQLLEELTLAQKTAEVHTAELQALATGNAPQLSMCAAVVVRRQVFPTVFKKNDTLAEPLEVLFVAAPGTAAAVTLSPLQVQLLCDSQQLARNAALHELLSPVSVSIDAASSSFKLPLKFKDGTKNTAISLKFVVQIALPDGATSAVVESAPTAPFVVTTHKDQFRGAAGVLMKRDCFGGALEVTWEQFANTLQRHFLLATRQELSSPQRPLSQFDLFYIRKTFFGDRASVSLNAFDVFWAWFGQALSTLRHQRPVLQLWLQGLVYGFANRPDVDRVLADQQPGTFLVRFSESSPGLFAVAYSFVGGSVKHYLVLAKDLALHKTLPEFLMSRDDFVNVLQLQVVREGAVTNFMLTRSAKTATFEKFLSKKQQVTAAPSSGYINV